MNAPATFTIPEAASLLGIGRNTAYEAAASGELAGVNVIRVGRRLLIPKVPLLQILGLANQERSDAPEPDEPSGRDQVAGAGRGGGR